MTMEEKLSLMKAYKNKSGKDLTTSIEIGESLVNANMSNINVDMAKDSADTKIEIGESYESAVPDVVGRGQSVTTHEEREQAKPMPLDFSDFFDDEDDMFKPMSFTKTVNEEEQTTQVLYESIKQMINDIDCTGSSSEAFTNFDIVLKEISDYNKGDLTNSQLLILISLMITKLEELNKSNYPEISLSEVKYKLDTDGNKAVCRNEFDKCFFESFYSYYLDVEMKQFKELTDKYEDNLEDFVRFQTKKSDMLMTLLKWLLH